MDEAVTVIFGAGFSGTAYGRLLAERGNAVIGTTRSADKAGALEAAGIAPVIFDGAAITDDLARAIARATDIVISIAPDETGDPVIQAAGEAIAAAPHLQWLAYLSTVGVYGNHDGGWVDEGTRPRPVSQRSIQRLGAENAWRDLAERRGTPLAILRLSGIYGPGRNAFANLKAGRARRLVKPGQVFNRIHVRDIARALAFLAERRADGIYNVTDDCPAPPQDVVAFAADVMKVEPPPEIDFESATLSPMARSFYGENKRVSNARIRQAGFSFDHPDYRTALRRMWDDGSWQAGA
ncbi:MULTISPECIES: SDR family NAD(P)-dependent oxidoreductase [unclassified Roseitalea]|uniref:SDR family NAD(P)-dependent oxidoreductase n=1 Tax=unclassified Roseitalea TaxID=2639107 RepID=UPI00273F32EE|nr:MULTISPECIES: SDR family NAD(P)-dependent oxidoreductase [unclassified Roseitalea]